MVARCRARDRYATNAACWQRAPARNSLDARMQMHGMAVHMMLTRDHARLSNGGRYCTCRNSAVSGAHAATLSAAALHTALSERWCSATKGITTDRMCFAGMVRASTSSARHAKTRGGGSASSSSSAPSCRLLPGCSCCAGSSSARVQRAPTSCCTWAALPVTCASCGANQMTTCKAARRGHAATGALTGQQCAHAPIGHQSSQLHGLRASHPPHASAPKPPAATNQGSELRPWSHCDSQASSTPLVADCST